MVWYMCVHVRLYGTYVYVYACMVHAFACTLHACVYMHMYGTGAWSVKGGDNIYDYIVHVSLEERENGEYNSVIISPAQSVLHTYTFIFRCI